MRLSKCSLTDLRKSRCKLGGWELVWKSKPKQTLYAESRSRVPPPLAASLTLGPSGQRKASQLFHQTQNPESSKTQIPCSENTHVKIFTTPKYKPFSPKKNPREMDVTKVPGVSSSASHWLWILESNVVKNNPRLQQSEPTETCISPLPLSILMQHK